MKKIILLVLSILLILLFLKFVVVPNNNNQKNVAMILYWGNGCPHCEVVKNYINQKKSNISINIEQKEVYYNRPNQQEMAKYASTCPEIDTTSGIGVPFAYDLDEKKCIVGDSPIIEWINQKSGINN